MKIKLFIISMLFPVVGFSSDILDIRQSMSKWNTSAVELAHGKLVIILAEKKVSLAVYKSMLIGDICSLADSDKPESLNRVENILVISDDKEQGYVFDGGKKECITLNATKGEKTDMYIKEKTHDF